MSNPDRKEFTPAPKCPYTKTCAKTQICEHAAIIMHEIKTVKRFGPDALKSQVAQSICGHQLETEAINKGKKTLTIYENPSSKPKPNRKKKR
jgi:hypothetical protein